MVNINFGTESQTFRKIMGNGLKYNVPKFQRDYAWDRDQWDDLWQDMESLEKDEPHYMGYLVLQSTNSRTFTVIDGQQRLTTISIIILAVLYRLKEMVEKNEEKDENQLRLDTLKNSFIGFTDSVSLATQPKLTLNRNNDAFFRNYLCALETPPQRNIKASERLLGKACRFFQDKLKEKNLTTGAELAGFVEGLIDRLLFTTITVGSDLNAYKVFETLNARGVQLSVPDLLKNYMFSVIDKEGSLHDNDIRLLEETWEAITAQLGNCDFTRFVQAEWNSRNSLTTKSNLFKKIKSNTDSREKAFEYIKSLRKSAEIYAALQNENDELWDRDEYKGIQNTLTTLNLFNIIQPHGLLLAAYHNFSPEKFVKIAGYIEVISVRYNIIGGRSPNEQETTYNRVARNISDGTYNNLSSVKEGLKNLYPSDDEFYNDFQSKHVRTAKTPKKARFLLARIENYVNNGLSIDDAQLTLEHVLPKNPNDAWVNEFGVDGLDDAIEMLGNMTLLQGSINKDLGNKSFAEKKAVYSTSSLKITKKCAEYDSWNKDAIEERQKWLSDQAKNCWKIEF